MSQNSKTITLEAPSKAGRKFYSIDLTEEEPGRYAVNFRHGAVGGSVKTGTKTPLRVPFDKAQQIYEALIREKVNGDSHYVPVGQPSTQFERPALAATNAEPFQPFQCRPPRLLNDIDQSQIVPLTVSDNWWIQIKHDGDRVQLHFRFNGKYLTLFSGRSGKKRGCPTPVAEAIRDRGFESFILDGELVDDTLWVFDVLEANQTDMTHRPYEERYQWLLKFADRIVVPCIRVSYAANTHKMKVNLINKAKKDHEEGVVFVNKNAPYEPGRPNTGGNNLRWKFKASGSFLVDCHHPTKASMDVKLYGDRSPIGSVTMIGKERPPVGTVVEVEYLYCQSALVQAVYKGVRTDVPAEDCTRRQIQFKGGIDPMGAAK
jgi:hypothetical protein